MPRRLAGRARVLRAPRFLLGCALVAALAIPAAFAEEKPPEPVPLRRPTLGRSAPFPLSVQAGKKVEVDFSGDYLDRVQAVRCECEDLTAKILSAGPLGLKAEIEAAPTASPGPRFLYVETPRGPSNRILFRVTRWESVVEQEPNDAYEQAHQIRVPVMVDGRIGTLTDSDMFRFHASAGERLAFNVLTGRAKAQGHVVLILMTAAGRELAHSLSYFGTDPYLDYTFEQEGDYIVTMVPRRFSDFYTVVADDARVDWQYQLAIGRSPILWSLFPMGGRRGSHVEAELRADFLDPGSKPSFTGQGLRATLAPTDDSCNCRFTLTVDIAPDAELGPRYLTFPDDSGALMPLAFMVSDTPEITESEPNDGLDQGQPVKTPVIVNGRIDRSGDLDNFLFTVDQFDELAFQVDAHGLGSQMTDPNLTLARPDGELKHTGDDRCDECPSFFAQVGKKEKLDSKFWHEFQEGNPNDADAAGDYILQLRDNSQRGGPHHTYRLLLRDRRPGFRVGVGAESVTGPLGGMAKVPVMVTSEEGFNGQIEITARDLPPGLTAKPLTLGFGKDSGTLEIWHDPKTLPPGDRGWVRVPLTVVGTARIGDQEVSHEAELPPFYSEDGAGYNEPFRTELALWLVEPALFSIGVEEPFRGFRMDLAKDGRVEVEVDIKREKGFQAPLEFAGIDLPEGVSIAMEGAATEGAVKIVLVGDPDKAPRGKYRIALRASAAHGGKPISEVTRGFGLQIK